LFHNSHLVKDFNFDVIGLFGLWHVEFEVEVSFSTSLMVHAGRKGTMFSTTYIKGLLLLCLTPQI